MKKFKKEQSRRIYQAKQPKRGTNTTRTALLIAITLLQASTQKLAPSKDNIVFLVEMARHGARAPLNKFYPTAWTNQTETGELTPVGERQKYALGLNTRLRYKTFFTGKNGSKDFRPEQYWVRSTALNRTLMSAFSNIFSLLDKDKKGALEVPFNNKTDSRMDPPEPLVIDKAKQVNFTSPLPFNLQAYPVHTVVNANDDFFALIETVCMRANRMYKDSVTDLGRYLAQSEKFVNFVKKVKKIYGLPADWNSDQTELMACQKLADFAIQDHMNNPSPLIDPKNGSEEDKRLYGLLRKCYYAELFQSMNNTLINQIAITPQSEQILTWLRLKINQTEEEFPLKYVHLSGHDSTVSPFVNILGLGLSNASCLADDLFETVSEPNPRCSTFPSVASNIVWELILKPESDQKAEKGVEDYIVKFSYNGVYLDHCKTGTKDAGGEFYCELDAFLELVEKKFIYKDYKQFCGMVQPPRGELTQKWLKIILLGVSALMGLFLVLLWILIGQARKLKRLSDEEEEEQ